MMADVTKFNKGDRVRLKIDQRLVRRYGTFEGYDEIGLAEVRWDGSVHSMAIEPREIEKVPT